MVAMNFSIIVVSLIFMESQNVMNKVNMKGVDLNTSLSTFIWRPEVMQCSVLVIFCSNERQQQDEST